MTLPLPKRMGRTGTGTRSVLLPVSERDTTIVKYLLETILEVDSSARVARALDCAQVRDITLAGKVRIVILTREDGEALLRGLFDFLRYGKPTDEQHNAVNRLVSPLAAAVRG